MSHKLTMKSALLKLYKDKGPMWNYEAVDTITKEYGCQTEYYRLVLRFSLMEMAGGGLLDTIDEEVDDGSHFKPDSVVVKYAITDFGRMRVETLLE